MVERTGIRALKFVFADIIGDVVYFPVWWYSRGALRMLRALHAGMRRTLARLAIGVWIRNFFVPMYGAYDIQGRIISVLVRFFQIIVRSAAALFWFALRSALFLAYLVLPPFIVWMILKNILWLISH